MIRFLFGAGSPHTTALLTDRIRTVTENGENAILLVPEQETVSAERRMVALLPARAQLTFEVLNFTRLANRTYRALGGLVRANESPAAEILAFYRALRELAPALLQYGGGTAENPRFAERLFAAKGAFSASLITPENLLQTADTLGEEDALGKKLHDLGMVFSAAAAFLREQYGKEKDELAHLPEVLSAGGERLFSSTHLFIDSFTDFTAEELAILGVLFRIVPEVTVTLPQPAPGTEGLAFLSAARTEQKLRRFAALAEKPVFFEAETDNKPADVLSFIRKNLFDMTASPAPLSIADGGKELTLTRCRNPLAESEHAAAVIHRLVRNGARYREITVVVRDVATYTGVLDAVFEKEGIPCFLSEKTDLSAKPLLSLILSALRIIRYGYRAEDVIGYLKTGLCGVTPDEVNFAEEYLGVWKLRGKAAYSAEFTKNPDGFSPEMSARAKRILAGAEAVRKVFYPPLAAFEEELNSAGTAAEQIGAIFRLLTVLNVREQLKKEAIARLTAGERKEAEELSRLFSVTTETLETAAKMLGDNVYSVKELQDALSLAFAHTDIGTIPTSADEVTIGSAALLRADHPAYVLVLGLCEGSFPQNVAKDSLLNGEERARMEELGLTLSGDEDSAASDELFYVWRAFTAPEKHLWLSFPAVNSAGKACTPSIAVNRVRTLFPHLKEEIHEAEDPLSHIYSRSALEEHFAECTPGDRERLTELLREELPESPVLSGTPVTNATASVPPALAGELFSHREISPSGLEKYAGCRFAYYCFYVLKLREEPGDTFSGAEVGTYIHFILEKAIGEMRARGGAGAFTEEEIDALIAKISDQYRKKLTAATGELTPRAEALFARLLLLAGIVVRGLFAEFADSLFTPAFMELSLKTFGETPTVSLSGGGVVPLTGKADRVDFWVAEDGKAYFRVVDYKTGEHKFDPEAVRKGASMQMPLYLMALCKNAHPLLCEKLGLPRDAVFYPAGITYLTVGVKSETTDHATRREIALENAVSRMTRSGVVLADETVQHALTKSGNAQILGGNRSKVPALDAAEFDGLFEDLSLAVGELTTNMKAGLADAKPRVYAGRAPCEYCPFGAVCRAAERKKN